MNKTNILSSVAYLKPIIKDENTIIEETLEVSYEDSPVQFIFNNDLTINFLYENDVGNYSYVQYRDLINYELTDVQLKEQGIYNLYTLTDNQLLLHTYDYGCHALTLDGNFEASLIMLETLWDSSLKGYITTNYAVAIPCRSVLLFCDADSTESLNEMKELINQAWEERDHLLTKTIYIRTNNKWIISE